MKLSKRHIAMGATAAVNAAIVAVVTPLCGVTATANVFVALLTAKAAIFVVLYGSRSNWRSTPGGRAVMALVACIATICAVGTLGAYLGDYPGRQAVRTGAFVLIGLTLMNLLLTLIEQQRRSREDA